MHRWNTRWRESLFSSFVLSLSSMFVSYTMHTPPLPPSFRLHGNQPKHLLFARRKVLASDWSVRGSSACTLCPHNWVNSYAVVVWARPGVFIVTRCPLPGTGKLPETHPLLAPPVLLVSFPVLHFSVVCMCVPQLGYLHAFTRHHSILLVLL